MHTDPSGESALDSIGNWWNKAKQSTIGRVIDTLIVKPVTSVVRTIAKVIKPVVDAVSDAVKKTVQAYRAAQQEIAAIDANRPTYGIEVQLIWKRACSKLMGDENTANEITRQLDKIQSYDKADWLFLTGDCLLDESIPLSDRFAMLDVLKEKHDITAEDLIALGLYTEETRYHPFFFGIFREDVAGNFAALLELSYRLARQGTTVWEMSLEEQRMRSQQQFAMLYYLGVQAGLSSVQAYNAAGSAIRMDGASVAVPGYESVPSDFVPFNYSGTQYEINVTNQTMYQLGNHFNNHGKPEMGYASKKEYQQAAYDFAIEARKSPDATIYVGTWNGRGTLNNTQQIIMQLDGKSVIINASTGQIIDYYIGTDNLGFINIVEWR